MRTKQRSSPVPAAGWSEVLARKAALQLSQPSPPPAGWEARLIAYIERLRRGEDETSEDRCAELEAKLAEREAAYAGFVSLAYETRGRLEGEIAKLGDEIMKLREEQQAAVAYANRCAELVDDAGVRLGVRSLREILEHADGGEVRVSIHELAEAAARLRRAEARIAELERAKSLREAQ